MPNLDQTRNDLYSKAHLTELIAQNTPYEVGLTMGKRGYHETDCPFWSGPESLRKEEWIRGWKDGIFK